MITVIVEVAVTMDEREPGHWVIVSVDVPAPGITTIPERLANTAVARWVSMRPTR